MIRESQPRPVTGEILAADDARPVLDGVDKRADSEDAVFVTLGRDARSSISTKARDRVEPATVSPSVKDGDAAGLSVLRDGRRHAASVLGHHFRQTGGPLFWGLAVVLVASAFWISGGYALMIRGAGEATGPALFISNVQTRLDSRHAAAYMLVEATVENRDTKGHRIPHVTVNVAAQDGTNHQFRLSARAGNLAPGAEHLFSGRIPAPKNGLDSVSVKLGNWEDL